MDEVEEVKSEQKRVSASRANEEPWMRASVATTSPSINVYTIDNFAILHSNYSLLPPDLLEIISKMPPVPKFESAVPQTKHCIVSFPRPNVVLVKLNRARDLNCINMEGHAELDAIWNWMDAEGALTCGIITGSGRAFSAGADLKGITI